MDPVTGLSYSEPAPHNFSFNSPQGACPKCKGLGQVNLLDMDKIVPDPSLSIYSGGIVALGKYKKLPDILADRGTLPKAWRDDQDAYTGYSRGGDGRDHERYGRAVADQE